MNNQNNEIQIDEIKLRRMRNKIYILETMNMKKKKYRHREIVEEIYKIMNEELDKVL